MDMSIYEIAHALRDLQDKHRALDAEINTWRGKVGILLAQSESNAERRARLAEHIAKYGNRPMITLDGK